jgi:hypothetical protein
MGRMSGKGRLEPFSELGYLSQAGGLPTFAARLSDDEIAPKAIAHVAN